MASLISSGISFLVNAAVTISVDKAELAAGQPVSLPKIEIGSVEGKPIYLEAVLSTT